MLPLRPGGRGHEETGRKGSSGREAVADTGPPWRRELSADTGLAEALFELATVNKEEWGVYAGDIRCCCKRPVRRGRAYRSGDSIAGSCDRVSPSF